MAVFAYQTIESEAYRGSRANAPVLVTAAVRCPAPPSRWSSRAPGRPARRPRPGRSSSTAWAATPGARSQAAPERHQSVRPLAIESTAMSAPGSSARTSLPREAPGAEVLLQLGHRLARGGGISLAGVATARRGRPRARAARTRPPCRAPPCRPAGPGTGDAPSARWTARARPRGRGRSSRRPAPGRRCGPARCRAPSRGRCRRPCRRAPPAGRCPAGRARAPGWPGSGCCWQRASVLAASSLTIVTPSSMASGSRPSPAAT